MSSTYLEAKRFAEQYIDPYSKESNDKAQFPAESSRKMGEYGYFKLLIPTDRGGQGKTIQEHVDICMALLAAAAGGSRTEL